ncbi:MAG: tail fiber protein [bacterium]|nr:tail fiber protein [bacterium]
MLENGVPVSGSHTVIFRLYDSASGGACLWYSDVQVVKITNGLFCTLIGQTTGSGSPSVFSNVDWMAGSRYLEIQIDAESPLQPRERLTSVAYALNSRNTESVPSGTVFLWTGTAGTMPSGWLLCNGAAVSRSTYAKLFSVLGTRYGPGDGATTFNLPDLVAKFPRGIADNPGTGAGSDTHNHTVNSHSHSVSSDGTHSHTVDAHSHGIGSDGSHSHGASTGEASLYDRVVENAGWGPFSGNTRFVDDVSTHGLDKAGQRHYHSIGSDGSHSHGGGTGNSSPGTSGAGTHSHGGSTGNASPGTDSQNNVPRYDTVLYIIKY